VTTVAADTSPLTQQDEQKQLIYIQGAPIKKQSLTKISFISVTTEEFFTKFTTFTEKVSGHIRRKFCYNIGCGLKIMTT